MNNAVKYRVIQITIANLAKNIDKVVTFLLKMYATENLSTFIDRIHIERMLLLVLPLVLELNNSKSYTATTIKYKRIYVFNELYCSSRWMPSYFE